jgi:hypothetical protein
MKSNVSAFINPDELAQYEEHVQAKINDVWVGVQQKQDKI